MKITRPHGVLQHTLVALTGTLALVIATLTTLHTSRPTVVPSPIPNPFFQEQESALVGSVTRDRYVRRNIPVDEYKFIAGERSEHLPVDRIALVHIPNHARIDDVTMDRALTNVASPTVEADAYGYKYSDADASEEIANIRATTFVAQFPGTFWTTAEAMSKHRADFESFAAAKGITWVLASTVRLDPAGSLHVIVANDAGGDRLTVQRSVCGDGTKEGTETCDDGDTSSGDGCSSACAVESGYECNTSETPNVCTLIGGGGGTGGSSSSSVASSTSSSHSDYACNGQMQSSPCSSSSSSSAAAPVCRNGIKEGTEQCDDGNSVDTDACTNECKNGFPVPFGEGGASTGNLYVTKATTPVRSRQLLGGTLTDEILRLQLRAEYEPVDVSLLRFSTTDHDVFSADRLELYLVGATTPFASATKGACGTGFAPGTFCASMQNRQLLIAKGSDVSVLVRPRMKTDSDGAVSGELVQVSILGSMLQPTVEARGDLSSNSLTPSDGDNIAEGEIFIGRVQAGSDIDISGNQNRVVLSKIVSITNASPDTDGTTIPTGNNRAIGQFKVTAAANSNTKNGLNKFALGSVFFSVSAQNVELGSSNFVGYNKADPTQVVLCHPLALDGTLIPEGGDATGNFLVSCAFSGSPVSNTIDSGSDETFVLRANVNNAKLNSSLPSSLQVSIQNFSDSSFTSFSPAASHLTWQDTDNGSSEVFWWIENPETVIRSTLYGGSGGGSTISSSSATSALCGNGTKEGTETCDDRNTANADGCNSACSIESNFRCTGTPSVCQSYLDFVKALADTNQDGTVSDNEALMLLFNIADAPGQSFGSVSRYDIDADGDVDNTDVALILAQLDILAPI